MRNFFMLFLVCVLGFIIFKWTHPPEVKPVNQPAVKVPAEMPVQEVQPSPAMGGTETVRTEENSKEAQETKQEDSKPVYEAPLQSTILIR